MPKDKQDKQSLRRGGSPEPSFEECLFDGHGEEGEPAAETGVVTEGRRGQRECMSTQLISFICSLACQILDCLRAGHDSRHKAVAANKTISQPSQNIHSRERDS